MALNVLGDDGSLFWAARLDLEQLQKDAQQIPAILEKSIAKVAQLQTKTGSGNFFEKIVSDAQKLPSPLEKIVSDFRALSTQKVDSTNFEALTKKAQQYAAALDELQRVQQAQASITKQRDTGKLSDKNANNILAALAKKETELTAIISQLTQANDQAATSFTVQKAAAEALSEVIDQSTQQVKEYLAALEEYNRQGIKVPVNQAAPTGKTQALTPTTSQPVSLPAVDDSLLKKSLAVLDALDEESQAFIQNLVKLKVQLKEVEAAQSSLNTQYSKGGISFTDFHANMSGLVAQEKLLKENLDELIKKQAEYDKINSGSVGFLNQKKIALAALKKEYGDLTEAELKDAQIGGQLKQSIASLQQEINALSFNAITEGGQKAVSLMTQLRQLKQRLADTPVDDPSYQKLFLQTAELKDKISDLNQAIKLTSSDSAGFDAMAQGLRGIAAAFASIEGVVSIFEDDQTKVQQATKNVTAALTILNGVQEITNILDKNSALNVYLIAQYRKLTAAATVEQAVATEGLAVAETAQGAAAGSAALETEALNTAMAANPAGILLLAITAVVGALSLFSSKTQDAKEKQKEINDAIAEGNGLLTQLAFGYTAQATEATKQAENAAALAQAQGKSEKEILSLRNQALKAKLYENNLTLFHLGLNKENIEDNQRVLNFYNKELKGLLDLKVAGQELNEIQKERLETLQNTTKLLTTQIGTAKPLLSDNDQITAQLAQNAAEAKKKASEDVLKSEAALAEARLIAAKKNTAEEYAAQVEAIKARTRLELSNVNLTSGERTKAIAQENKDLQEAQEKYNVLQLTNQQALTQAKLSQVKKGSAEELKLRIDLINQSAEIELSQSGLTEEKKKQIRAAAAKSITDETKKSIYESSSIEINTLISQNNARLSAVKAGTVEELSIKKDLVDEKALLDVATAKNQIDNEKQLAARIQEVNAKAIEEKRKLDDDYIQHVLDNRLKVIQYENDLRNNSLEGVTGSPIASEKDKAAAQLQILLNNRDALSKQISEVENAMGQSSQGDVKLLEKRRELWLQILNVINQINNQVQTTDQKAAEKIVSDLSKLAGVFNSIGDSVAGMNEDLSTSLKVVGSIISSLSSAQQSLIDFKKAQNDKDTIGQVAGIGGIASAAIGIVGSIVGIFTKAAQERKKLLAEMQNFQANVFLGEVQINELYRQRRLEQAKLNQLRLQGLKDERDELLKQQPQIQNDFNNVLAELQKQTAKVIVKLPTLPIFSQEAKDKFVKQLLDSGLTIDQINEKFKNMQETFANISLKNLNYDELEKLFTAGQLDDRAKALFEELQKLKQAGLDVSKMLDENKKKAQETFAGTTADSIVDSIADGFSQGFRSVQQFADKTEDVVRGAMMNALKYQFLQAPIQKLFEQFAADAESGGGLDLSEITNFTNNINGIISNAEKFTEQLEKSTGINLAKAAAGDTSAGTLSGAIKGMTEDQAQLLAGQFGGMRLTMVEQLKYTQQSLTVHQSMDARLAQAVIELAKANSYWRDVTTPGSGKRINI